MLLFTKLIKGYYFIQAFKEKQEVWHKIITITLMSQ